MIHFCGWIFFGKYKFSVPSLFGGNLTGVEGIRWRGLKETDTLPLLETTFVAYSLLCGLCYLNYDKDNKHWRGACLSAQNITVSFDEIMTGK